MLIRPTRLQPGDTIGILAPASAPPDPKNIDRSVAVLKKLGFKVKLSPNVRKRLGFLAGSDHERAGDLMRLFADRRVNAILCVRGGYGAARLLPLLDYRVIRDNAKIFVGYSDLASLHCAFLTKANLISFHGPMLNSDFVHEEMPKFTLESFLRTLGGGMLDAGYWMPDGRPHRTVDRVSSIQHPTSGVNIAHGYRRKTVKILRRGLARGRLIGGNLTLLCTTIGTPWQPPFRDAVFFFEDLS